MAAVATPITNGQNHQLGDIKLSAYIVALDASYPTGGYPLTPAQLALNVVQVALADVQVEGGSGSAVVAQYNKATSKLQMYTATAEVANAVDLSADTVQVVALGY